MEEDLHNDLYEFRKYKAYYVFHTYFSCKLIFFYIFFVDPNGRMKRRRGPTKLADIEDLPKGTKIVVMLDWYNVPISKFASILGSNLGTIVAPLNVLKWIDPIFKRLYHQN